MTCTMVHAVCTLTGLTWLRRRLDEVDGMLGSLVGCHSVYSHMQMREYDELLVQTFRVAGSGERQD